MIDQRKLQRLSSSIANVKQLQRQIETLTNARDKMRLFAHCAAQLHANATMERCRGDASTRDFCAIAIILASEACLCSTGDFETPLHSAFDLPGDWNPLPQDRRAQREALAKIFAELDEFVVIQPNPRQLAIGVCKPTFLYPEAVSVELEISVAGDEGSRTNHPLLPLPPTHFGAILNKALKTKESELSVEWVAAVIEAGHDGVRGPLFNLKPFCRVPREYWDKMETRLTDWLANANENAQL